jgi:hypothetical protein
MVRARRVCVNVTLIVMLEVGNRSQKTIVIPAKAGIQWR